MVSLITTRSMNQELYNEVTRSDVLSKHLIDQLMESMNYSSISFINWTIEALKVLKTRIDRGDQISDEISHQIYTKRSFHQFVKKNFSPYIESQVFNESSSSEKIYFSLEPCEDGYNLRITDSSKSKTFEWISSLSERFSLVQMIATGIVYLKDVKSNHYQPFISENGKYCRYDKTTGHIVEI